MLLRFSLGGLSSLALAFCLTACTQSKPNCQQDPAFYLRGTAYDCATQREQPARTTQPRAQERNR